MNFQEYKKLEAQAMNILENKNPEIVWKAIDCGVFEKMHLYAENHNYEVNLNELVDLIWTILCCQLAPQDWNI